jgi:hypothetical protein
VLSNQRLREHPELIGRESEDAQDEDDDENDDDQADDADPGSKCENFQGVPPVV